MTNGVEFDSMKPKKTIQTSLDCQMRENPMGETQGCSVAPFWPQIESRLSRDKGNERCGLLAYRELDEALDLTAMINTDLRDSRTGRNTLHSIAAISMRF